MSIPFNLYILQSDSTFESCYPDDVFVWKAVMLAKLMKDYFNILTTLKSDTQLQGP